ncbi:signal peptidase I [Propionicicella superfundia]|uniref:signal peptidase I n=1 Tax=Propionicicella superfundia TaxID=348582 RepID=UPI00040A7322|nr:signal peptidase I [Propionicicella superfundia]
MKTATTYADALASLRAIRPSRRRRLLWRLFGALGWVLSAAVVALVLLLVVIPRVNGGTTLTVMTGSMQPGLRPGDVVATRAVDPARACDQVKVGDLLSYLPLPDDPTLITHRVVGVGTGTDTAACTFLTKGDANSTADKLVLPVQTRGVVMYSVPWVGNVRQWLGTNADTALWVLLGAVLLVGLASLLLPRRRLVEVTLPADPRIDAADAVLSVWRSAPHDREALDRALAECAEIFETRAEGETEQDAPSDPTLTGTEAMSDA